MAENEEVTPVVTGSPTARVADSYGDNPHEFKPSQEAFDPDADEKLAEEQQASTEPAAREEESSPGNSSSTLPESETSSGEKSQTSADKPALSAGSRTSKGRTGSDSAVSTDTERKR